MVAGMGRPKSPERSYSFRVRLNSHEVEYLKHVMARTGYKTYSEAIRFIINKSKWIDDCEKFILPPEVAEMIRGGKEEG